MKLENSSKQILLAMVKKEITETEEYKSLLQIDCSYFYKQSDIDNKLESNVYFEALNATRTHLKITKKRIKKLSIVSKELKLSIKSK